MNEQSGTATASADPDRACVVAGGVCAGVPLWPALGPKEPPATRMHIEYIAHQHPEVSTYLMTDWDEIVGELAAQALASAHVSLKKYQWSGRAIAVISLSLLGVFAIQPLFIDIGSGNG